MINPDNSIHSNNRVGSSNKKEEKDKPEGIVDQAKFKEVYAVYEHKKSKEELDEDWEDVKEMSKKGTGTSGKKTKPSSDKPVSLFDLAKEPAKEGEEQGFSENPDSTINKSDTLLGQTEIKESPEEFVQKRRDLSFMPQATSKKNSGSLFDLAQASPPKVDSTLSDKGLKSDKFTREMPDLSQVNVGHLPQAQVSPITAAAQIEKPIVPQTDAIRLQKIIDEIVEHVYQLERSGETSTIITIGNEKSAFHGASIKITELDTSKGQLNITIDNLRPEAKVLIEKHEAELFEALKSKGYQVQQLISTTEIENPRFGSQKDQRGDEQRQQEQQKRDQKRQNNDDQEEDK